jgi:hypothetical protein
MPDDDDPFAHTRYLAAKRANEDMRRDEPRLLLFANTVTCALHPWVSLRLWLLKWPMRR